MAPRPRRARLRPALLLALALAAPMAGGAGSAQTPLQELLRGGDASEQAPAKPAAEPASPSPIPLPDVAARAEEAERRLREMRPQAEPVEAVRTIESQLEARRRAIEEGLDRTDEFLAEDAGLDALRDAEQAWLGTADDLAAWRRTLTKRATGLEERVAELATMRERWTLTRTEAQKEGAPSSLLERIGTVLGEIAETERAIGARRREVLTIQNRVAQEEVRVADTLDAVSREIAQRRSQLLRPDRPPLWTALARAGRADLVPQLRADLGAELERSRSYFTKRTEGLVEHGLLLLAVLALLIDLRRRARAWPEDDPRRASAVIWERPVSTTLLVGLLSQPWFHPHTPDVARDLGGLVVLIPLLRLLPALLPRALRPALYGLAAFYVVDQVRDLLGSALLLERLVFLVETAVAAGLVLNLLRPRRLARLPRGVRLPSGMPILMRLGAAALLLAVAANVLGLVGLARLLGQGALRSAYAGLLLYGGLRVALALLRVLLQSRLAGRLHMVRRHRALLLERARRVIVFAVGASWVVFTLELFTLREAVFGALRAALSASLSFGTVSLSLGDVAAFGVTVTAAVWIARSLTFLLEEDVFPRVTLQRGIPGAISATARYAILLGGFLLAVAAAGVDFERFTILAGALGVGIGFGLQNVVNNFVSGLILLYERPIQVGDAIELTDLFGEVKRIGIRSSTVRTWDGAEVIVPNGDLISARVTNWTLSDRQRRMTLQVGVAYGSDPRKVLDILLRVAREHPDVLDEPRPFARFVGFGDSSLDFQLWAFVSRFEIFWPTFNDVILTLHDALREAGITIPFPQRDLHLVSADPRAFGSLRDPTPGPAASTPTPTPTPSEDEP